MPRAKSSKRTKGAAPTFTTSFEELGPSMIAFVTNVTPVTFNDPPLPCGSSLESTLFPSSDAPPRKITHTRKKGDDHIPRPPNAFILFRSSFIKNDHVSSKVETNHSTLSKIIGATWQLLPAAEKQIWLDKAKLALEEHKIKYPGYSFRPSLPRSPYTTAKRRKVREVGPKDQKRCEKIAELLVEGKKGEELDAAVSEFDRQHVPEFVARFDAPVTAHNFRRSSSAPAEADRAKSPFLLSTSSASGMVRAASSQPVSSSSPVTPCSSTPSLVGDYDPSDYSVPPPTPFESQHEFPMPTPNPDMGFESFSFNQCAAVPAESCDPLANTYYEEHQDIFAPQPQLAYQMQQPAFHPSDLRIDTSVANNWSAPSTSPFSSIPSTPSPFPADMLSGASTYHDEIPGPVEHMQDIATGIYQQPPAQEQYCQYHSYCPPTYTHIGNAIPPSVDPSYEKYVAMAAAAGAGYPFQHLHPFADALSYFSN